MTDTQRAKVRQNPGKTPEMSTSDGQKVFFPIYREMTPRQKVFLSIYVEMAFLHKVFSPIYSKMTLSVIGDKIWTMIYI